MVVTATAQACQSNVQNLTRSEEGNQDSQAEMFNQGPVCQEDDSSNGCQNISRYFKLSCKTSKKDKLQSVVNFCVFLILCLGLVKIILGVVGVVNGDTAAILAKKDGLYWAGIIQMFIGVSSVTCGVLTFRVIIWQGRNRLTSKQLFIFGFVLADILFFDVVTIVLLSNLNTGNFTTEVTTNMEETLKEKYGVGSSRFQDKWDSLQRDSQCCGAFNYTDWLDSVWSDELKTFENLEAKPLPLSCRFLLLASKECDAVSGIPLENIFEKGYLLLANFSAVTACDSLAVLAGEVDYVYNQSCAEEYAIFLIDMLSALLFCCVGFGVIDVLSFLAISFVLTKLPNDRRVDVYQIG